MEPREKKGTAKICVIIFVIKIFYQDPPYEKKTMKSTKFCVQCIEMHIQSQNSREVN
jgi:hypothetical protein